MKLSKKQRLKKIRIAIKNKNIAETKSIIKDIFGLHPHSKQDIMNKYMTRRIIYNLVKY